jgi:hypothetical protein
MVRLNDLPPGRRWLVEAMRKMVYGTIEDIVLIDGEPMLDPLPKVLRSKRLGAKNSSVRECAGNYLLKQQVLEIFEEFDQIGSGIVARIDVRDGLPYKIALQDDGGL